MAHVRITEFAGIMPELSARLKSAVNAQIAHNCLLTDGSLRPQAQWVYLRRWESAGNNVGSVIYDPVQQTLHTYIQLDAVQLNGEPFTPKIVVGADTLWDEGEGGVQPQISWCHVGGFENRWKVGIDNSASGSVSYTRSYDSIKPVNRIYAISRVRIVNGKAEEGPLRVMEGQSATDVLYEGDLVNMSYSAYEYRDGVTNCRLYRSISGLDTGENVTNELDTEWHLVTQSGLGSSLYIDGESATALPLDVYYARNFHPPALSAKYFGLSESGWFVAASESGDIQVSERYMHHAWPVDNHLRLAGETITDMVVQKDTAYIGTTLAPYAVALAPGEDGLQAAAVPFPESLPCLPGTMTAAPGGALYASGQGVVALSREGSQVISRDIANPGDVLFRKQYSGFIDVDGEIQQPEVTLEVRIDATGFGAYYQGQYYGFMIPAYPRSNGGLY